MPFFEKTLTSEIKYKGRIITVKKDTVELENGKVTLREVVEHNGGVGIVALDDDGFVYFVRQYRYPMSEEMLEIPAGKLEDNESPEVCAVRELSEETGFEADSMICLGSLYPSPGYCREVLFVYLATGLRKGDQHLDEDEFLSVEKYTLKEAEEKVMNGEITDAKTVIGILKTVRLKELGKI